MPKNNNISIINISPGKSGLSAVRYAAYALSGSFYVFLSALSGGRVRLEFKPKPGTEKRESALLAKKFRMELEDEKLRERIAAENSDLREFLLLKALNSGGSQPPPEPDSSLTPKQEKELNALILQIEKEIAKESSSGAAADPLGITGTWEEKYASKTDRKKKR